MAIPRRQPWGHRKTIVGWRSAPLWAELAAGERRLPDRCPGVVREAAIQCSGHGGRLAIVRALAHRLDRLPPLPFLCECRSRQAPCTLGLILIILVVVLLLGGGAGYYRYSRYGG